MNYKDAAETCTNEGATLAIVLSKAENYFLSNFAYKITSADRNDPMIGLFCTGTTTSSCRWIDGTPLIYSNFMAENNDNERNAIYTLDNLSELYRCYV